MQRIKFLYFLNKRVFRQIRHRPDDGRKNQNEDKFHYSDVYIWLAYFELTGNIL